MKRVSKCQCFQIHSDYFNNSIYKFLGTNYKYLEVTLENKDQFISAAHNFFDIEALTISLIQQLIDHIDVYETKGTSISVLN